MIWDGAKFVAVGIAGSVNRVVTTTVDGITWTAPIVIVADNSSNLDVASGAGEYVVVGGGVNMEYSPDLTAWTANNFAGGEPCNTICFGSGLFVAPRTTAAMTSTNGINFGSNAMPTAGIGQRPQVIFNADLGLYICCNNGGEYDRHFAKRHELAHANLTRRIVYRARRYFVARLTPTPTGVRVFGTGSATTPPRSEPQTPRLPDRGVFFILAP